MHDIRNPCEAAAEANKEFGVVEHIGAFHDAVVSGQILCFFRRGGYIVVFFLKGVAVDAEYPIAKLFQVAHNDIPSIWIMPSFGQGGGLDGDADIFFLDGTRAGRPKGGKGGRFMQAENGAAKHCQGLRAYIDRRSEIGQPCAHIKDGIGVFGDLFCLMEFRI